LSRGEQKNLFEVKAGCNH